MEHYRIPSGVTVLYLALSDSIDLQDLWQLKYSVGVVLFMVVWYRLYAISRRVRSCKDSLALLKMVCRIVIIFAQWFAAVINCWERGYQQYNIDYIYLLPLQLLDFAKWLYCAHCRQSKYGWIIINSISQEKTEQVCLPWSLGDIIYIGEIIWWRDKAKTLA